MNETLCYAPDDTQKQSLVVKSVERVAEIDQLMMCHLRVRDNIFELKLEGLQHSKVIYKLQIPLDVVKSEVHIEHMTKTQLLECLKRIVQQVRV